MKRWVVDLTAGKVFQASLQEPQAVAAEYISFSGKNVFVIAVDELGAFVRAKQMLAEAKP
jgi:hypothetical protein